MIQIIQTQHLKVGWTCIATSETGSLIVIDAVILNGSSRMDSERNINYFVLLFTGFPLLLQMPGNNAIMRPVYNFNACQLETAEQIQFD